MISSSSSTRAYHRPLFNSSSSSSVTNKSSGRALLDLLRTRDKLLKTSEGQETIDHDHTDEEVLQMDNQIIAHLSLLNDAIQCNNGGLFSTSNDGVQKFYACAIERQSSAASASSTTIDNGGGEVMDGGKKRKRKKGGIGSGSDNGNSSLSATSYGIYLDSNSESSDQDNNLQSFTNNGGGGEKKMMIDLDEGLIITSLCKILNIKNVTASGGGSTKKKKKGSSQVEEEEGKDDNLVLLESSGNYCYSTEVIVGALNVLLSICQHAKDHYRSSPSSLTSSSSVVTMEGGEIMTSSFISASSLTLDMLGSIDSYLLIGLCNVLLTLYHDVITSSATSTTTTTTTAGSKLNGITNWFKVCASLISCLSIKSSSSSSSSSLSSILIPRLYSITWTILNNLIPFKGGDNDDKELTSVIKGGTILLSTVVLLGGGGDKGRRHHSTGQQRSSSHALSSSSSSSSANVWNESLVNGILMVRWAIHTFFPIVDGGSGSGSGSSSGGGGSMKNSIKEEAGQYPNLWKEHESWLAIAKDNKDYRHPGLEELDLSSSSSGMDPTDVHRSKSFQLRIRIVTSYIIALLQMESYPITTTSTHQCIGHHRLPLDAILDITEILLSFPLIAETKYRSTKSRLRSSPVKNGLISPNAGLDVAPAMKICGVRLFDVLLNTLRNGGGGGGGVLLRKARRIIGMVVSNLQSSCSVPLVSSVDGNRGRAGGIDKSRILGGLSWTLRNSIPLRIRSIQTFQCAVLSLGSGVMLSVGTVKSMSRALILVGGCLLEQVTAGGGDADEMGNEWGTLGEKARLVEISSNALAACFATFGGLIPNNARGTLDSIIHTCLSTLYSSGSTKSIIFAYPNVKRSLLQLGMNTMCVPWGDGGRSTLSGVVRAVSTMLRNDPDTSVSSTALSTLCVFDAFTTPRAPPILIPTRISTNDTPTVNSSSSRSSMTASSLIQSMNESKLEMISSKEAKEEKRAKKTDKKSSSKRAKNKTDERKMEMNEAQRDRKEKNAEEKLEISVKLQKSSHEIDHRPQITSSTVDTSAANEDLNMKENKCRTKVECHSMRGAQDGTQADDVVMEMSPSSINVDTKNADEEHDDEDSEGSLGDFPDIVDEGPDEEDM